METIPAVVEAKPDYMGLVFAPSKRQVTVDQAKTLVEELHKQYANRYNRNAEQYSNDVVQDGTIINALQEETATGDAHEGTLTSTENISPTLIHQEFIKDVYKRQVLRLTIDIQGAKNDGLHGSISVVVKV